MPPMFAKTVLGRNERERERERKRQRDKKNIWGQSSRRKRKGKVVQLGQ